MLTWSAESFPVTKHSFVYGWGICLMATFKTKQTLRKREEQKQNKKLDMLSFYASKPTRKKERERGKTLSAWQEKQICSFHGGGGGGGGARKTGVLNTNNGKIITITTIKVGAGTGGEEGEAGGLQSISTVQAVMKDQPANNENRHQNNWSKRTCGVT